MRVVGGCQCGAGEGGLHLACLACGQAQSVGQLALRWGGPKLKRESAGPAYRVFWSSFRRWNDGRAQKAVADAMQAVPSLMIKCPNAVINVQFAC